MVNRCGRKQNVRCCATSNKEDAWKTKKEKKVGGMGGDEEHQLVRSNWFK